MKTTILNKTSSMYKWKLNKGDKVINWYINNEKQFSYLKSVCISNDNIEIYTKSNGSIDYKRVLNINDTITIESENK